MCMSVDYCDIRIKNASQGPVFCLFRYFVVYYELTNHIRLERACRFARFARFAVTHQDRPRRGIYKCAVVFTRIHRVFSSCYEEILCAASTVSFQGK